MLDKHIFGGANTGEGFLSYYNDIFKDIKRVFILKGGPGTGKSTIIKKVAKYYSDLGYHLIYVHCSGDVDSLDGVIVSDLSIAVVDATSPHPIEPTLIGIKDEIINLAMYLDRNILLENETQIIEYNNDKSLFYKEVYKNLREASYLNNNLRDSFESIDVPEVIGQKKSEIINKIFDEANSSGQGKVFRAFCNAITPSGVISFEESILKDIEYKLTIDGEKGMDVGNLLDSIIGESIKRQSNIEIFYSYLDPSKIAIMVIGDKKAIINNNLVDFTFKGEGEVINVRDIFNMNEGIDMEAKQLTKQIHKQFELTTKNLTNAKKSHEKLEAYYIRAMDFSKFDEILKYITTYKLVIFN